MNTTPPCQYLSYTYDQEELSDFALYCMKKYDHQFYGKLTKFTWTNLSDLSDQNKLKTILKELFDMFESIGQPLVQSHPRIFYLDPLAFGGIHKDPVYGKNDIFEFSKWAVNIPAVESSQVDLEFFEEFVDTDQIIKVNDNHNEKKQPFCMPKFYNKYIEHYQEKPFKIGSLPEEQILPFYKKSFTDTMILDTTVWHRSNSHTDQLSIRFQYQSYVGCQKSFAETVEQLNNYIKIV